MAALVVTADALVGRVPAPARLALLVPAGALAYAGGLLLFGRPLLRRLAAMARGQADWI